MSSPRDRISAELARQSRHEGETANIAKCRIILKHAKTSEDFRAFVSVRHNRYGKMSYETHRFYYVREWIAPLIAELADIGAA